MKPVKLKPSNVSIQKAFQKKSLPLRLRDFCEKIKNKIPAYNLFICNKFKCNINQENKLLG